MTEAQIIQILSYLLILLVGIMIGVFATLLLTHRNPRIDHHHDYTRK